MATASKCDESFSKSLELRSVDRSIDDAGDDFEVVSDAHLVDPISIISEYGSRGGDDGTDRTVGKEDTGLVIDPLSAFEMIQSEHRLLKDELEVQNEMLRQRLLAMEAQDRRNAEEVAALRNEVDTLSMELSETKMQQSEMELQVKYFKESSEKADLLTAKLLEAEDLMKSQHETIQQLRADGYGGAPTSPLPTPSTDESLKAELACKDEQVKRMECQLARLESSLGAMNGERLKAKQEAHHLSEMNRELQGIITDLQSQAEVDKGKAENEKAEWDAIRSDLEQQIQVLSDRVLAFENQYSGASMNETESGPPNSSANATAGTPTLRHRDAPQYTGVQWVECHRCHLPMATVGPHPCPAIIDGLD